MEHVRFFLDSADLSDIEWAGKIGFVSGVTVNQTLMAKEPRPAAQSLIDTFENYWMAIQDWPRKGLLSVPLVTCGDPKIWEETIGFAQSDEHKLIAIKVPVSRETIPVIAELAQKGITVNATCIFNGLQAAMAAEAGAEVLSVFVGRINDDTPGFGWKVLEAAKKVSSYADVLAGSIRDKAMVGAALDHGADIVTTSRKVLESLADDPGSARSIAKFNADYEAWSTP
jgi:transaldolase